MDDQPRKNAFIRLYQCLMDALYVPALLCGWGRALWDFCASKKNRGFWERLGFYSQEDLLKLAAGQNIWIHAASAGEVNAILSLCEALKKAKPSLRLILTATSATGRKLALEKGPADFVFMAPLDMSRPLSRAFRAFQPLMILIVETEFWPLLFFRAVQTGTPLMLVNGRVSNHSYPGYKRFRSLFAPVLRCFSECLVQTAQDGEKLKTLGVEDSRVKVAGQMKYDLSAPGLEALSKFRKSLGIAENEILFTLGSLREGEEDPLLAAIPGILSLSPRVKVLAAPRHLKNAPVYMGKLESLGMKPALRTGPGGGGERVLILDTVGELQLAYGLSRAAFVGGTLVPVGGHNIMEPALCSVPVCYGPFTENVKEAAQALLSEGGGFRIQKAEELIPLFREFLREGTFKEAGSKARQAVLSMGGATEKTAERVLARLDIQKRRKF
jgi:3-deoxy-D-manno-octulosonic-acid transferase